MTDLAVVLIGEIEDALRKLPGPRDLKGLGTLITDRSRLLQPGLLVLLWKINNERCRVFHKGEYTRGRYTQGKPLFSQDFAEHCTNARDQLLSLLHQLLHHFDELQRICKNEHICRLEEQIEKKGCMEGTLHAMKRSPQSRIVQAHGTAALLSFSSACHIRWDRVNEFSLATRILEAVLQAMELHGSTREVQRDACAVISYLANANLIQPLAAKSCSDAMKDQVWELIGRSLRAVGMAMRNFPDDCDVQLNASRDLTYGDTERERKEALAESAGVTLTD